jgi:hypothetical protein
MRKLKITLMMVLPLSLMFLYNNCSKSSVKGLELIGSSSNSSTSGDSAGDVVVNPDGSVTPAGVGGGAGATLKGTGSMSVPTADAVIARIVNGLEGNVNPYANNTNFGRSLAQVRNNLPRVSDPLRATGYDSVQMLVYAACSDLTTGGNPMMQSRYGVNPNTSLAQSKAALVAAGTRMLDVHTAGIASKGPNSAQVASAFDALHAQLVAGGNANTTKVAFISFCIAANTAGITMLGM